MTPSRPPALAVLTALIAVAFASGSPLQARASCPGCRRPLLPGAAFCHRCGSAAAPTSGASPSARSSAPAPEGARAGGDAPTSGPSPEATREAPLDTEPGTPPTEPYRRAPGPGTAGEPPADGAPAPAGRMDVAREAATWAGTVVSLPLTGLPPGQIDQYGFYDELAEALRPLGHRLVSYLYTLDALRGVPAPRFVSSEETAPYLARVALALDARWVLLPRVVKLRSRKAGGLPFIGDAVTQGSLRLRLDVYDARAQAVESVEEEVQVTRGLGSSPGLGTLLPKILPGLLEALESPEDTPPAAPPGSPARRPRS